MFAFERQLIPADSDAGFFLPGETRRGRCANRVNCRRIEVAERGGKRTGGEGEGLDFSVSVVT